MSDSSGDSSVGVEPYAVDTALLDQNNIHSEDQKPGRTSSSSGESDSESSSDEEDSNTALVEATPMSKELGFVDIFAMKTKMDEIHAWLKEVVDGSTGEHVYIPKSALRHHKRAVDGMRHCLRDTGPMAAKISQYMDASVKKTIEKEVNKAIEKMSKSGGAGSAALKELLAQTTFKPGLLDLVEQRVLKDDEFPHESSSVLKTEIGDAVSYHLGCALYKQVFEQTEAELRKKKKKLMADRKKSLKGVMEELLSVLPHSEHDPTVS